MKNEKYVKMRDKMHLVHHHNMFGPSCEVASGDRKEDFEIYCRKEHGICVPDCTDCKFFEHGEMGKGVCCLWEESSDDISGDDRIVVCEEVYFEYLRVEEPEFYKECMKMIEEGDLDLCKAWLDLD